VSDSRKTDEFVLLLSKDGRWIFSYILMLVSNKTDAEEVFQETSVTLWQKSDEFAPGSSFRAWATQVAHYKVLHYRARKKNSPLLLDDTVLEAVHGTAANMTDRLDDLHRALAFRPRRIATIADEAIAAARSGKHR
jgi:RNA polymerase sigma-70 factor, ECF subfamily